jgi:hypothetical protein
VNIDENKLLMLANAKRQFADLTDFEVTNKCISRISLNELSDKKIVIQVKELV